MTERELIEEMAKDYKLCYPCEVFDGYVDENGNLANGNELYRCLDGIEPTRCSICKDTAKVLIGACYRKVDEGAVVLTKEEFELFTDIKALRLRVEYVLNNMSVEDIANLTAQVRKETAREILKAVRQFYGNDNTIALWIESTYGVM